MLNSLAGRLVKALGRVRAVLEARVVLQLLLIGQAIRAPPLMCPVATHQLLLLLHVQLIVATIHVLSRVLVLPASREVPSVGVLGRLLPVLKPVLLFLIPLLAVLFLLNLLLILNHEVFVLIE